MRGTQEFYDLQEQFENNPSLPYMGAKPTPKMRARKNEDGTWPPFFYQHGKVNEVFEAYMAGYAYAKCVFQQKAAQ